MISVAEEDPTESTSGWFMPKRMQLLELPQRELESRVLGSIAPTSPAPIVRHWSFKPGLLKSSIEKSWAGRLVQPNTYFQNQELS